MPSGTNSVASRFQPGNRANPIGRPKGSRNKLQEAFWRDFAGAWEVHGKAALEKVAVEEPGTFVKVAASIMPKEIEATVTKFVVELPAVAPTVDAWIEQSTLSYGDHSEDRKQLS